MILSNTYVLFSLSSSELRGRVSELERNLSAHEKEVRSQASKLQELQTQLNKAHKDLSDCDRDLTKTRHELSQATDRRQHFETKVGIHQCNTVTSRGVCLHCPQDSIHLHDASRCFLSSIFYMSRRGFLT